MLFDVRELKQKYGQYVHLCTHVFVGSATSCVSSRLSGLACEDTLTMWYFLCPHRSLVFCGGAHRIPMANHSLNPPGSALADKGFTPVEYSNAYSQARIQDLCVFVILFAQSCQVYETQLEMFFLSVCV